MPDDRSHPPPALGLRNDPWAGAADPPLQCLGAVQPAGAALPFLAVAVSVCSEGFYYQFRALPAAARLEWKWIIAGNVFSSLLLMAIPPLTLALKKADPYLPSRVEPSEGALSWAAALGSLAAFGLGFLIPLRWKRKADLPDADSGLDKGSRA